MSSLVQNSKPIKTPEYYAALDGFRGLLAVFVAIYHTIWFSHPQTWRFFGNGPVIIDLFFAFSGFLMWRLYADRLQTPEQLSSFFRRRFARLYPLHLFMLLVFMAFGAVRLYAHKLGFAEQNPGEILPFEAGSVDNWFGVLQNLTMTNALGLSDALTFNPPSWTVGAEFCTYLIFAAMMMWCKPHRVIDFVLIGVSVILLYVYLWSIKPSMNITHDYGFFRCVAGFYTGVLAAVSFPKLRGLISSLSKTLGTVLELVTLCVCILFVVYASGKAQFLVAPFIFLFVVVFAADKGAVSKFMSHRVFQYLAKISYSVYLVHVIIAFMFGMVLERLYSALPTGWTGDMWLVLYLVVVLVTSHFTFKLIEVPGGRLIRNWNRPKKQVAKAGSSV